MRDGKELPWDGKAFGDLKVRGPWVASAYYGDEPGSALDADGWFATGDVATIDPDGFMEITDRSKDVIKSGGEWISSIALENIAVSHPDVAEAAVIAAPPREMGRAAVAAGRARGPVTPSTPHRCWRSSRARSRSGGCPTRSSWSTNCRTPPPGKSRSWRCGNAIAIIYAEELRLRAGRHESSSRNKRFPNPRVSGRKLQRRASSWARRRSMARRPVALPAMEGSMTQLLSQVVRIDHAAGGQRRADPDRDPHRPEPPRHRVSLAQRSVVTSDQALPAACGYTIVLSTGALISARPGPRDPVHNLACLRLDSPVPVACRSPPAAPRSAPWCWRLGADFDGSPTVRLTSIHGFPAFAQRPGARRPITLDLAVRGVSHGGMVLDAEGRLLGMASASAGGEATVVVPHGVIARFVEAATAGADVIASRAMPLAMRADRSAIPQVCAGAGSAGSTPATPAVAIAAAGSACRCSRSPCRTTSRIAPGNGPPARWSASPAAARRIAPDCAPATCCWRWMARRPAAITRCGRFWRPSRSATPWRSA